MSASLYPHMMIVISSYDDHHILQHKSPNLCCKGSKRNKLFFGKTLNGGWGGLAQSEISISEKMLFLYFFSKGWGVSPIPERCYHKNWGFLDIFAKRGGYCPINRDFIIKNWEYFGFFCQKGGGVSPIPKFPYQKKMGPPNCWKGAGGTQNFGVFLRKKTFFFVDDSPNFEKQRV